MNRRIRVAIIAPYPASAVLPAELIKPKYRDREHAASWVRALAGALAARQDIELKVFVDSRAVTRTHTGTENGISFVFVPKMEPIRLDPWHLYLPGYLRLKKHIAQFGADVVHGFGTESGCGAIALMLGLPSVVSVQGIVDKLATLSRDFLPRSTLKMYRIFERRVLSAATLVLVENEFAGQWVRSFRHSGPTEVIPHGVNPEFFETQPDFSSNCITCIGTPGKTKGTDVLLRAFALCADPHIRLQVIGGSTRFADYQKMAQSLGIGDWVDFMGQIPRQEIVMHLASSRFAVLPSRMDTSPNAITEAHAANLPVVATRTGGIPEMVEDGIDGILVPVDDAASLATAMNRLLADPDLCRRMGHAGREKVRRINNPDSIAEQHAVCYRQAIDAYLATIERNDARLISTASRIQSWFTPIRVFASTKKPVRELSAFLPPSWRVGRTYWYWRQFLKKAQYWPHIQIEAWQLDRMRKMVRYAYENTEGYRDLYRNAGISPDDIQSINDFKHLPFITRAHLQDSLESFSVPGKGRQYVTTGGSTGIPLGFYYGPLNRRIEMAFMHSGWAWAGWKLGTPSAVLRGAFVGSEDQLWHYDRYTRELALSSYHLGMRTLPKYIDALKQFSPTVLQAYPSSLNLFCDLLKEAGLIRAIRFNMILLGSENVYDWQLQKFAEVFPDARIMAWYGQVEQVILAPWCEKSRKYHIRPFYGLGELLDDQNRDVEMGGEGELVGTSFHNLATPLIRYRTLDRAVRGASPCPACGRHFTILDKVSGRSHEVIVTHKDRYISMTAVNMHDDIFDGLRQFQFFQESKGRVTFKYVPRRLLSSADLEKVRGGLATKFGDDVELSLQQVDNIPRTKSGKFRFLEQRLEIRYGEK